MGQQQLLIAVLVTVIAVIATAVAVTTFNEARKNANLDAVNLDVVNMATIAQGYYQQPEALGGAGKTFEGISFYHLAFSGTISDSLLAYNENGTYAISLRSDTSFVITATPASGEGYIEGTSGSSTNTFTVEVLWGGLNRNADGEEDNDLLNDTNLL